MRVLFIVRGNPAISQRVSKAKTVEATKDVRQLRIVVDGEDSEIMYDVTFRRYEGSTHKANVETIEQMASHLQHFADYFMKVKESLATNDVELEIIRREQDVILSLIEDLEHYFSDIVVEREVEKRQKIEPDRMYRDVELEVYQEFLENIFVNNHALMDLIIQYNKKILLDEMVPDPAIDNRLTSSDCFIIHCLIVYSRLIYLPYFKIKANVSYIEICRGIIIKIGNAINERMQKMDCFPSYETEDSFISRLFAFLWNACSFDFEKNIKNLQRYAIAGMAKESTAMRSVIDQILTTFSRLALIITIPETPAEETKLYTMEDLPIWSRFGMVSKNTAGYLQKTKRKIVDNELGNIKPKYIIHVLSSADEGGTEMSATSRWELQAEKTDKEQYQILTANAEYIMDDIYANIGLPKDTLSRIYENIKKTSLDTFKTDLNKMFVSYLFLSKYGADVSNKITFENYVYVCIYIYERLLRYNALRGAILSSARARLNSVEITEDMFTDKSFLIHNKQQVLNHLTKICSTTYVLVTGDGKIGPTRDIQEDLIRWINDGMLL